VSKAVRFLPAVAVDPDRELAEARSCIDRGDEPAALRRLDRARRGFVKRHDQSGLEHVLVMAAVLENDDERVRIGRANLEYAVKQNLRLESRRAARSTGGQWEDPYPGLGAPSEHTKLVLTRGVKLAIGAGVLLGSALLIAIFVLPWFFESSSTRVTLRLLNDTPQSATVRGCDDVDCSTTWMHRDVDAGLATEDDVDVQDFVALFKVKQPGRPDTCLPVRVHDGFQRLPAADGTLVARLSQATPCPGTTVLPEPALETGL
jgi:hypothetical protein